MSLSLHAVTVPAFLQTLGAIAKLLDKAEAAAEAGGGDLVQARLAEDMLPFAYQVKSTVVHSMNAIEAVRVGAMSPDRSPPPEDLAGLRAIVGDAVTRLQAIDPAEMDALVGRDMRFSIGEMSLDFTAEDFLLSFSLPNFYFHAAIAYGILRANGIDIGKRDYLGKMRIKARQG